MLILFIFGCSSVELENVDSYQEAALNSETQQQSATTSATTTTTQRHNTHTRPQHTTSATTHTTQDPPQPQHSATTTTTRPASNSGYRAASQASLNPELCKLADRRGLTRYVYEEPIIEGIDYTHRQLNREQNIAYVNPMFSTGPPMVPDMNPSIGTLEVAFLAIDFPDSPGSDAQLDLVRKVADEVANYFHTQHLMVDCTSIFRFGDRVFRVSQDSDTFGLQGSGGLGRDLTVEVVKAVDPHIDFTGVHNLYMLIPENNTQIANDWHYPPHPGNTGSGIPNGGEGDRDGRSAVDDQREWIRIRASVGS